jgi:hypothetical protein
MRSDIERKKAKKQLGFWYSARLWWYTKIHRYAKGQFTKREAALHVLLFTAWMYPILVSQVMALNVIKSLKEFKPMTWLRARDDHTKRNIGFGNVIKRLTLSEGADPHEIQRDCLYLIANYVRSWRRDEYAKKIFANLLVEDPSDDSRLVVIARDHELFSNRRVGKKYLKTERAVAECFETQTLCVVGDAAVEYPDSHREAEYRSILGIPLRDIDSGRVLGVLSIDSSEPFHFSIDAKELETNLQPYIAAIESTLTAKGQP